MKICLAVLYMLTIFSSLNLTAREVIISGVVTNPSARKGIPQISISMAGRPFLRSASNLSKLLGKSIYDTNSGNYSITVNVDDQFHGTILVATVLTDTSLSNIEVLISKPLLLDIQTQEYTVDITLPEIAVDDLSFQLKLFHNGQEYDYNRPYECIIKSSDVMNAGQIIFLSDYDYVSNKNKVNNIQPGEYRAACAIKNLFGGNPDAIRKVFDITLPLVDSSGNALPESERIVTLNFDDIGGNGEGF